MTSEPLKNISIIGVGLIGGSIGLAIKNSKIKVKKIIGIGRNIARLKIARKLRAVDEITTNIKYGVKNADMVFVCLPVNLIVPTVKKILPYCKKGAVITDVGSVKKTIVGAIKATNFIGGHPIAGSEKTSVKYANGNLFKDIVTILTPTSTTDKKTLKVVKNFWKSIGAKVKIMSPEKHDKILSFTSHLPHVVAFSLLNSIDNLEFTGSGFRDTTRIAAADPKIWAEIIFQNRTYVRAAIRKFKNELSKVENAKSIKELTKIFKTAKTKKDKIIDKHNNRTKTEHMFGNQLTLEKRKILNEQRIIRFINTSLKRRNLPPTVREVAKYFHMSVSTAHTYLKNLYDKKLIRIRKVQNKNTRVARGIIKNNNRTYVRF